MKINNDGLNLLTSFEGLRLTAYRDVGGILTVGYGHTGPDVHEGQTISQVTAIMLLHKDLEKFEDAVTTLLGTALVTDNQFSAMVCLAYNIGIGNFAHSTVLKETLSSQTDIAASAFVKWDKVNGKDVPGLLRRREAEMKLFLT